LAPGVSIEIILEDVIEPGLGESIPSTEGDHSVLPGDSGESRSRAESLSLSLDNDALSSCNVVAEDIVGIVTAIVTANEVQRVVVDHTFVFSLASHAVGQLSPFTGGEIKFVKVR
jgi:hypothetical protein